MTIPPSTPSPDRRAGARRYACPFGQCVRIALERSVASRNVNKINVLARFAPPHRARILSFAPRKRVHCPDTLESHPGKLSVQERFSCPLHGESTALTFCFSSRGSLRADPLYFLSDPSGRDSDRSGPALPRLPLAASQPSAAPINDNCSAAIDVASLPFTDTQDTTGATDEVGEPPSSCTGSGKSVWYTFVNPMTNAVLVTVDTGGSNFNTTLQILTGTCPPGTMTAIMCGDDANIGGDGLQSLVTFVAQPGITYYIQAGGYGGASGNLIVHVNARGGLCPVTEFAGAFDGSQSSQTGRVTLNGVVSSCSAPKACPGSEPTGAHTFVEYAIPNTSGVDQCLTVNLQNDPSLLCSLQSVAYLDSFNPADVCANFLADPGSSTSPVTRSTTMSFVLPTGHSAVLVVSDLATGASAACGYTLTVIGDTCSQPLMAPAWDTADAHAVVGDSADHNGVLEPGETAQGQPSRGRTMARPRASGPVSRPA